MSMILRTESIAGIITFLTMSYILAVNTSICPSAINAVVAEARILSNLRDKDK